MILSNVLISYSNPGNDDFDEYLDRLVNEYLVILNIDYSLVKSDIGRVSRRYLLFNLNSYLSQIQLTELVYLIEDEVRDNTIQISYIQHTANSLWDLI
ncbi:MAG: hypothetical protein M0P99_00265 [Candidatus Cloacimonetes bacterium]|jgi:predicted Zn-dependent protease|nr:hypothetical protein [Candidatus Cloacimonadota bacterium]